MFIYIAELIAILLLGIVPFKNVRITNRKVTSGANIYLLVVFLILGTIMAFRAPKVGTDTASYYIIHKKIADSHSISDAMKVSTISSAPIYVLYVYLLSKLFSNLQVITFFNSLLISAGFYRYIKKTSDNYQYSCFLFIALTLYFEAMNGTRQFVAIAIALNAYIELINDIRNGKAWMLLAFASLVHSTVAVLVLGIIGSQLTKKASNVDSILNKSIIISLVVSIAYRFIIQIIANIVPYFLQYTNGSNSAQIFNNSGSGRIIILYAILFLIVMLFTNMLKHNHTIADSFDVSIYPSIVFCVIAGFIFSKNVLLNRVLWCYICLFISFIPNVYSYTKNKKTKAILSILTGALLLIYCAFHLLEDKSGIIPYIPFWSVF